MEVKNNIKKIYPDAIRSKSLLKMSKDALNVLNIASLNEDTMNIIFRELYEGLRQYVESIGYLKGFKFRTHEAITLFLKENLNEKEISLKFDKYRKLRNGINYYGNPVNIETVREAIKEIPKIIKKLSKYFKKIK